LIESVVDAAAAASVTPDWAISGARAEQRAACAAQASEGESSSFDRERSRRSRGGERHTRLGDQRCTRRSRSMLLLLSLSEAWAAQAARCSARAPLIAQSGVTLAAAAASATLSIEAALALFRRLERHRPLAARRVHR